MGPGEVRAAVEKNGFASPDVVQVDDPQMPHRYIVRVQEASALGEAQKQAVRDRLCLIAEGAPAPTDCPEPLRAEEVKFSPGGDRVTVRYAATPDLAAVAARIEGLPGVAPRAAVGAPEKGCVPGKAICAVGEHDHKIEIQLQSTGDQLLAGLRAALGSERVPERALSVQWIGPRAGAQLRDAAFKSTAVAVLGIMLYLAVRFDARFVPGAVVSVIHDVGIAVGAGVITRREITLSTVAAVLTIAGYSMSDTVVVFDRMRENLRKHPGMGLTAIINLSVSEMFGRTVISSGVTLLSMVMFLVWGTGVLKDFAFTLVVGIVVITYSSIYVAAPITEWVDRRFFGGSVPPPRKPVPRRTVKRLGAVV